MSGLSTPPPNTVGSEKPEDVLLTYEIEVDGVQKSVQISRSFKSFLASGMDYVETVLNGMRKNASTPCIIGVVGGAGCGKSTFCEIISQELNAAKTPAVTIGMDAYHYRNEYLETHYTNTETKETLKSIKGSLETIDVSSIHKDFSRFCIGQGKTGETESNSDDCRVLMFPAYDRNLHEPVPGRIKVDLMKHKIVFFEGLHLLANDPGGHWAALRTLYDGLIVLKVPIGVCKRRVIARKVLGGRSKADALEHWNRSDLKIHEAIKQQILSALESPPNGAVLLYDGDEQMVNNADKKLSNA